MVQASRMYAELILPLAAPGFFTYSVPKHLQGEIQIGKRVVVSFGRGKKLYTALVYKKSTSEIELETKEIIDCIDNEPVITEKSFEFWTWMAEYYMCSIGEVMSAALPGIMNLTSETSLNLNEKAAFNYSSLDQKSRMLVEVLERNPSIKIAELSKSLGNSFSIKKLKELVDQNILVDHEEISEKYKARKSEWLSLSNELKESIALDEAILTLNRAPKQLQAFMHFIEMCGWDGETFESEYIKKPDFLNSFPINPTAVRSLIKRNLLSVELRDESRLNVENLADVVPLKKLSKSQSKVMAQIENQFEQKDVILLQGVTSSGKTEIYVHLIEKYIESGKQVLYLLPEIALTKQLIHRLSKYFGDKIGIYHSRLSQEERVEVWKKVRSSGPDRYSIIMGARSSVFLPFNNLGFVVIDEEHDRSYKQQDPAPRYMARDSAVLLAKFHNAKTLLGSATPSLESRFNVSEQKYGFAELGDRYGGFQMPEIKIVDVKEDKRKKKMKASFSSVLIDEMRIALNKGEQVILFQNRRGYAIFLLCENCAHSPKCINCDVSLTHHKNKGILLCHLCNYRINFYNECKECNSGHLIDIGVGTQRIEEDLNELMPEVRTARFDLDSTRKKHAFHNLIQDFESHNIDILIGTQMVTKGLDFENVGLVGILNADQILGFPDFRSFERAFQTLTQVSGRAGRKKKRGKVIIQTYDAEHPVIKHVVSGDFEEFFKSEMAERKSFHYPPYYRMIELRLKYHDRQKLFNAATALGKDLKRVFGEALLGPEFPFIERVRNRYTMHFILRFDKTLNVQSAKKKLSEILASFTALDNFRNIKFQFDIDPY